MHVTYGDREILIKRMTIDEMDQVGDFLDLMKKSATKETENILPRPVVRDGNGKLIKDHTPRDFYLKLQEEIFESFKANFEWFLYREGRLPLKPSKNDLESVGKVKIFISKLSSIKELAYETNDKITIFTSLSALRRSQYVSDVLSKLVKK